jgi:hypothetical protein
MATFKSTIVIKANSLDTEWSPIIRQLEVAQESLVRRVLVSGSLVDLLPSTISFAGRRILYIQTDQPLKVYADTTGLKKADGITAADPILLLHLEAGAIEIIVGCSNMSHLLFENVGMADANLTVYVGGD